MKDGEGKGMAAEARPVWGCNVYHMLRVVPITFEERSAYDAARGLHGCVDTGDLKRPSLGKRK